MAKKKKAKRLAKPASADDIDSFIENDEVVCKLANGWTLRSGGLKNPLHHGGFTSGEYVRLCKPDGTEHLYWHYDEWEEDPICVMGAIINAAAGYRPHADRCGRPVGHEGDCALRPLDHDIVGNRGICRGVIA